MEMPIIIPSYEGTIPTKDWKIQSLGLENPVHGRNNSVLNSIQSFEFSPSVQGLKKSVLGLNLISQRKSDSDHPPSKD